MGRSCLVVIDMQKGFINKHTEHLIEPLVKYVKHGRFDMVVGTRYVNHPDTACYKFENWKDCMAGSEDVEIIEELKPFIHRVFDKDKYSCWNDEFKQFVKDMNIDTLTFVGVNTGCCVLHSAFDSYNDVVSTYVVENLCGSTSGKASHDAAIKILKECITRERVILAV